VRTIKFRAWHKQDEVMVCFDKDKLVSDTYQQLNLVKLMRGDFGDVLMQYTGLKDRNGVEIYEGDKVETSGNVKTKALGVVNFYKGCFRITYRDGWHGDLFTPPNIEVIGHIHEGE